MLTWKGILGAGFPPATVGQHGHPGQSTAAGLARLVRHHGGGHARPAPGT